MIAALYLPQVLQAQIEREARAAFPRECCGLIEGVCDSDVASITAIHPTGNLSEDADRFEIDPAEHIRLLRNLRGTDRAIIGCYHSHPNGVAAPSERDRRAAADENFLWLVCAIGKEQARIGAFVFERGQFRALDVRDAASA